MQLKRDPEEKEITKEATIETAKESGYSNNDFFNPEQEFDFQGDGIFDPTPTLNDNASSGVGGSDPYYGSSGAPGMNGGGYSSGVNNGGYDHGVGNDGYNPDSHPRKMTKQEFYESPQNRKNRDRMVISSIVIIVCAIADWIRTSFTVSLLRSRIEKLNEITDTLGMGEQYIIDVDAIMRGQIIASIFFIILGIGIFKFKSRACALTGLIYSIVNMIYVLATAHRISGYYSLIAFIYATVATFALARAWKDYEDHGDWTREW